MTAPTDPQPIEQFLRDQQELGDRGVTLGLLAPAVVRQHLAALGADVRAGRANGGGLLDRLVAAGELTADGRAAIEQADDPFAGAEGSLMVDSGALEAGLAGDDGGSAPAAPLADDPFAGFGPDGDAGPQSLMVDTDVLDAEIGELTPSLQPQLPDAAPSLGFHTMGPADGAPPPDTMLPEESLALDPAAMESAIDDDASGVAPGAAAADDADPFDGSLMVDTNVLGTEIGELSPSLEPQMPTGLPPAQAPGAPPPPPGSVGMPAGGDDDFVPTIGSGRPVARDGKVDVTVAGAEDPTIESGGSGGSSQMRTSASLQQTEAGASIDPTIATGGRGPAGRDIAPRGIAVTISSDRLRQVTNRETGGGGASGTSARSAIPARMGLQQKIDVGDHLSAGPEPDDGVERIARYRVRSRIGKGGMGEVLGVADSDLNRDVALKQLLAGKGAKQSQIDKFLIEAQVTGQLEHPNIVPVHELGLASDGRLYFTMKYVRGKSLNQILRELRRRAGGDGPRDTEIHDWSLTELLETFLKICDGVAFAHSRSVVHRDLKPDNVMVGEFGEVLVMDWGLAKVKGIQDRVEASVRIDLTGSSVGARAREGSASAEVVKTMDGMVLGTPAYMPPEQADGDIARIDHRSDIFSLGAILYQLLTLEVPFTGRSPFEVLAKVVQGELEPPTRRAPGRKISPELEAVVLKAMAHSMEDRYQSVPELQQDIRAFLEGRTLSAFDYSLFGRLSKFVKRNKVPVIAAVAVIAISAGVFVFMNRQQQLREAELEQQRVERLAAEQAELNRQIDGFLTAAGDRISAATARLGEADTAAEAAEQHRQRAQMLFDSDRTAAEEALDAAMTDLAAARGLYDRSMASLEEARSGYDQVTALQETNADAREGLATLIEMRGELKAKITGISEREQELAGFVSQREAAARARREREQRAAELRTTADGFATEAAALVAANLPRLHELDAIERQRQQDRLFELYDQARDALKIAMELTPGDAGLREFATGIDEARTTAVRNWQDTLDQLQRRDTAATTIAAAADMLADGREAWRQAREMVESMQADPDGDHSGKPEQIEAWQNDAFANLLGANESLSQALVMLDTLDAPELVEQTRQQRLDVLLILAEQATVNGAFQRADFWITQAAAVVPEGEDHPDVAAAREFWRLRKAKAEGYDSAMAAGRLALERGDPAAAVGYFESAQSRLDTPEVRAAMGEAQFALQLALAREAGEARAWTRARRLYEVADARATTEEQHGRIDLLTEQLAAEATEDLLARAREAIDDGSDAALAEAADMLADCAEFDPGNPDMLMLRTQLVALQDAPDGFVYVPGGRASLGSPNADDRNPARTVAVTPFYMAVREVTVGEYRAFIDAGGYDTPDWWDETGAAWLADLPASQRKPRDWQQQLSNPGLPVVGVSAHEAAAWCRWASSTGEQACRLPTDAEWELVARHSPTDSVGVGRAFPWGDDWSDGGLDTVADLRAAGDNPKDKSAFGCLDMGGNACEWVVGNDTGGGDGPVYGVRGASNLMGLAWRQRFAATSKRGFADPDDRRLSTGFRVVRPA